MDMEAAKKLARSRVSKHSRLRVAIVDDSCAFLAALEEFLADDARVSVVGRAVRACEAEDLVPLWKPDLVLLDVCLPDGSGLEAAGTLKRGPNPPHVVVMTIHESPEYPAAARAAGADGFLSKSDIGAELPKLIDRLCLERGFGLEPDGGPTSTP